MKMSVNSPVSKSSYLGSPLSVRRAMRGKSGLQPMPNGPLPLPESYRADNSGPKPERPELAAIGTLSEPVPVDGLAENFSSMPRIAPPPLGKPICGGVNGEAFDFGSA